MRLSAAGTKNLRAELSLASAELRDKAGELSQAQLALRCAAPCWRTARWHCSLPGGKLAACGPACDGQCVRLLCGCALVMCCGGKRDRLALARLAVGRASSFLQTCSGTVPQMARPLMH